MTAFWIRAPRAVTALTAFAFAACGDTLNTGTDGPGDGLTADIGATTRDEVEALVSALTLSTSLVPIGTTPAAPPPTAFSGACVAPSSPTDSDGDGIPDDATYLFTAPPCRFTGWRGGSLDIVGQLRIQDPAPSNAGFGYEATLTQLRTRFTTADDQTIYDVERNGTRVLSGSISSLLLSSELQVSRNFAGKPDAAIDQQLTVTYTPATSLQINAPIPSGTLDIAGTMDWLRGNEQVVLTVTTPTPLQYNAGCTETVQRIDEGELQAAGTFVVDEENVDGIVRVRWTACGREPSFSFEATE